MEKKSENQDDLFPKKPGTFVDRTDQKWYQKNGTNRVVFCDSIDEIIGGKSESFTFKTRQLSVRVVNKNEKEIKKNNYVLFSGTDGTAVLVRKWNELK